MTDARRRVLAIMGSGETAPTMGKVHRRLVTGLGSVPKDRPSAVMLDTPYGFQENADVITAKAQDYFRETVGQELEVASFRSQELMASDPVAYERMLADVRSAAYVFAGPGSPSYALAQWSDTPVATALADKLRAGGDGGIVTFASAAAITLGPFAIPVYEIYKVGQPPHWLDGLDLMGEAGLRAVVVPHFNNAEGGNHDTRFCYMGERRLSLLEEMLPEDVFVLGVDEHTACVMDLDASTVTVEGIGRITVRRRGHMTGIAAGETLSLAELASIGQGDTSTGALGKSTAPTTAGGATGAVPEHSEQPADVAREGPLLDEVSACEKRFEKALVAGDAREATAVVLEVEAVLAAWAGDMTQSDHLERGRSALRTLLVRLGQAAENGVRDPREAIAPYVEALLQARERARADRRWHEADELRDRLLEAGVEVHDGPAGTEWSLS